MTGNTGKLWIAFCHASESATGIPNVSMADLYRSIAFEPGESEIAMNYLRALGAIDCLGDSEVRLIGSGESVGARVIALGVGDQWTFMRIRLPEELQPKFAAQLSLARSDMQQVNVSQIMEKIGLTPEELSQAKEHKLSEDDWHTMCGIASGLLPTNVAANGSDE